MQARLEHIGKQFQILGDYMYGQPFGSGHINDTYAVTYSQADKPVRYIHQRINAFVFKQPQTLMENIDRVTRHQHDKLKAQGTSELSRACLQLVGAMDGRPYFVDEEGRYWRTYRFIENAHTYDVIQRPQQAYEAAVAFGRFQKTLVDLPGERLHETIPDFHNTKTRFAALEDAVSSDPCHRRATCRPEIDFALQRKRNAAVIVDLINSEELPERITHNDTKLNNVMLDDLTHEGICVIDLDTVMPGSSLYDFGDLVRSSTSPAAEDEIDLTLVTCQMHMFEALAKGYLSETCDFLIEKEKELLVFACRLITFENGMRFLTDYLCDDPYFKTGYPQHNLVRCRTQFQLMAEMERLESQMTDIVAKYI
jgi:hypothetical protein